MPRKKERTGVDAYFEALQQILNLQSKVLTGALPHYGDRGRNDEERCRDFLAKVLPKKFSIGSGHLICSNPNIASSSQTDVVIFDEIQNSPLHKERSSFVYPAEIVYGTVEVKGVLQSKDLKKIATDIEKIRALAPHRWYVRYGTRPKGNKAGQLIVEPNDFPGGPVPSRSFVFAYSQKGWSSAKALAISLETTLKNTNAHVHGLIVLEPGWYLYQEAYSDAGTRFFVYEDRALLRFVSGMLHCLSSFQVHQASMDRYLGQKMDI